MRIRSAASLILALFLFLPSALALSVPEKPQGYVSDYAGILSSSARVQLESVLSQFEKETSNQVVVVTFPSLEGESLEDFSIRLAEKWKIGQKGKDNGVIFLIFRDDRKMRIEVGYGLEGVLTDATSGAILNQIVRPRFREGKFDEGISEGVQAIIQATRGEFHAQTASQGDNSGVEPFFIILFWAITLLLLSDVIRYGIYWAKHRRYKARYSLWEWWLLFSVLLFILKQISVSSGGHGSSGGGGSSGSSGGGGGFSGGGGSFGGGGSSGGW